MAQRVTAAAVGGGSIVARINISILSIRIVISDTVQVSHGTTIPSLQLNATYRLEQRAANLLYSKCRTRCASRTTKKPEAHLGSDQTVREPEIRKTTLQRNAASGGTQPNASTACVQHACYVDAEVAQKPVCTWAEEFVGFG